MLTRDYMLGKIDRRLYDMEKQYEALSSEGAYGTESGLACRRSRCKRDICILTLLYEITYSCRECNITNEDAILGFEKLVKD